MDDLSDIEAELLGMTPNEDSASAATPSSASVTPAKVVQDAISMGIETLREPFAIYDVNDKLIYANAASRAAWPVMMSKIESGMGMLDACKAQVRAILPDFTEEQVTETATAAVAAHTEEVTSELLTVTGRWMRLSRQKFGGQYFASFGMDITDIKEREASLILAYDEAEAAKNAGSAFLARMSHEVKTPLNAIVGMSDALLEDDISADTRETIEFILGAADGLNHVLGQTLDHAKIMADKIEVDYNDDSPAEVVRSVIGMWTPKCKTKGISMRTRIDPNVPDTLFFDRYRYQQCLNNLISNAVKFTDEGGITVALKYIDGKNPRLALAVKDSGIGMDEDAQARIFVPFEQADASTTRRFGGTGLGMNITQSLISAMGGKISVKSAPGEGTTFIAVIPAHSEMPQIAEVEEKGLSPKDLAYIPQHSEQIAQKIASASTRAPAQTAAAPATVTAPRPKPEPISEPAPVPEIKIEAPAPPPDSPFAGLHVLCVEDNPVNAAVVKKLIGRQVGSLSFAENGQVALETMSAQNFDVVLMDIHMPVMNGIETTQRIRSSEKPWANVCIIALTADPDFQYQRVCRNIGMNDAIGKPVKRKDILDAIGRTLDSLKDQHAQKVNLPVAS